MEIFLVIFFDLAIRRKLYGDPVYKQNLADIKDRDKRIQKGTRMRVIGRCKIKVFEENDKSSIPSYYVDKDRNIPISDFNDIKGNLTSRYSLTNPYILFEIRLFSLQAIPEEK